MLSISEQLLFLKQVSLFREMTFGQLMRLLAHFEQLDYPEGKVLYDEGAFGQRFYIIVRGTIRVVKDYGKPSERELTRLNSTDFFGEMGIFEGKPHVATLISHDDVCVFVLAAETFKQLLAEYPTIALAMGRELSARVRRSTLPDHPN